MVHGPGSVVRPVDQMNSLYRPISGHSTLITEAHNLFRQRMRFDLFNSQTLDRLAALLEKALVQEPHNLQLKYELAFTLVQNEATDDDILYAKQLLDEVLKQINLPLHNGKQEEVSNVLYQAANRLYHLIDTIVSQRAVSTTRATPRRVNWAINNRCVMVCKGCYNVFSPYQLTLEQIKTGIDKLIDWGTQELILSGGDPILWQDLPELLDYIYARSLPVGIDTTGYTLTQELTQYLADKISYLGLPLDGSSNSIQNGFRRGPKDIVDRVRQNLAQCDQLRIPVKINTTVTSYNIDNLLAIGEIISQYDCVEDWSIFQWWGLRSTPKIRQEMSVPAELFEDRVQEAARQFPQINLRSRSVTDRELTHFFVQNNGQIVTFGAGVHEELLLGHILRNTLEDIISRPVLDTHSSKYEMVTRFKNRTEKSS